jgi:nitroreductase
MRNVLRQWMLALGARCGPGAAFCLLFSSSFRRELRAVYAGLLTHGRAAAQDRSEYLLRRNIHRIEKGLLLEGRRPLFALDYILPTARTFAHFAGQRRERPACEPLLRWADTVLAQYFGCAGPHPVVDQARIVFDRAGRAPPEPLETAAAPDGPRPSYAQVAALIRGRKSVRAYADRPVPRSETDRALNLARFAPSACNRQPFEFRIFDRPEEARRVASAAFGAAGFAGSVPALAVLVGHLRAFDSERDRHLVYVDGALAALSFMYALESLGLSSCPINWPDVAPQERAMAALLGLRPDERPTLLISFGYPAPGAPVARSERKSLAEIARYGLGSGSPVP